MKRWLVVTPQFSYTEWVCAEGGPSYDTCDVVEVEAETARDAVKLGVKLMLEDHRHFTYCHEQRQDGACPYTGVWAEPADMEVEQGELPPEVVAATGGGLG